MSGEAKAAKVRVAETDLAAVFQAGVASANDVPEIKRDDTGRMYWMQPNGNGGYSHVDLSSFDNKPTRIQQIVTLHTGHSFAAYVNLYATKDRTIIFADKKQSRFAAVFDYHSPTEPSWLSHRAFLSLMHTPGWLKWTTLAKNNMSQEEFVTFLDGAVSEIAEPSGGKLAEIARNVEASVETTFRSARRDDTGAVTFLYDEQIAGKSGGMPIPTSFTLVLAVYEGQEPVQVEARLKWRLVNKHIQFSFEIVDIEKILDAAFTEITQAIATATQANIKTLVRGKIEN